MFKEVTAVIEAGGYDLADLLHRIDVLYAGGRLTDEERENLYELARTGADPDDSLPDVTERVGALELRVAALEHGTYQPSEPEGDPEWPEWSADSVSYKVDDVVQHADRLWRCEQAHTSQESWTPDAAPSLWSQIDIAGDGVDVWTQPTGAHNAYNVGDRVHYPTASDPIYVSAIDGNVWSPDTYPQGWQLEEAE